MARGGFLADLARDVARADPTQAKIAIVIAALGAAFALWRAWVNLGKVRLIEDTPTSKTRSAPQGYVELEGAAQPLDETPIVSPVSGLRCCWYRFVIEERVTSYDRGREIQRWQVVNRGESKGTFWLRDDTGRVLVNPEDANVEPRHKDVWHSHSSVASSPLASRPETTLASVFASNLLGPNRYRFTEWRIDRGDPIYAIGLLKNIASHNASTVEADVSALLSEWKNDQPALRERFDLNKNGRIDQDEWMLARAQARREVMKARTEQMQTFNEGINILGPTHDPARPFLLATYRQVELIQRYRWAIALYGAGFFALGIAAVWILNTRFG